MTNKQGFSLGFVAGIGNISPGLVNLLVPLLIVAWGLAYAYLAWFLLILISTVVFAVLATDAFYFQLRRKGVDDQEAREIARTADQDVFPNGNSRDSLVLLGSGMGIANAGIFALVPKYIPDAVGGASGWIGGVGGAGTLIVLPVLGASVDVMGPIGYARGFLIFVILSGACISVAYLLKRADASAR